MIKLSINARTYFVIIITSGLIASIAYMQKKLLAACTISLLGQRREYLRHEICPGPTLLTGTIVTVKLFLRLRWSMEYSRMVSVTNVVTV